MSSMSDYQSAWLLYLIATSGLIIMLWHLSRAWRYDWLNWRWLLLLSAAAVLFVPVGVPDTDALAPAWLVAMFELVFVDDAPVLRLLLPMLMALLIIFSVTLLFHWRRRRGE